MLAALQKQGRFLIYCIADFQSAGLKYAVAPADSKSAIQQVENPRYYAGPISLWFHDGFRQ